MKYNAFTNAVEILDSFRIPINKKERADRIAGKSAKELYPYYGATGQAGVIDGYLVDGEYVLLGEDGAPFLDAYATKAYLINGKAWINNHAHILKSKTNNKFLCYYLNYFNYKGYVSGTTRLKLTQADMKRIPIPDFSGEEQERIVSRIEELFSELDAGVDTLQKIKQQLAIYRQAVRKEAFANNSLVKTVEVNEIADDIRIGPFGTLLHKSDYISGGVPIINPQHIKGGKIAPDYTTTISSEKAKQLYGYELKTNDIIVGRRGEMGRTAAITETENGWICGTGSLVIRLKQGFDAHFYAHILSSPEVAHYLEEHATGTTMKNLNEDIVRHIPVPFVTIEIQKMINASMDRKMTICGSIEKTVDEALQKAAAMRQSILKQAFEGGL